MPFLCNRKKGIIVNISSLSAVAPSPLLTVYSATKVCEYLYLLLHVQFIVNYSIHVVVGCLGFLLIVQYKYAHFYHL